MIKYSALPSSAQYQRSYSCVQSPIVSCRYCFLLTKNKPLPIFVCLYVKGPIRQFQKARYNDFSLLGQNYRFLECLCSRQVQRWALILRENEHRTSIERKSGERAQSVGTSFHYLISCGNHGHTRTATALQLFVVLSIRFDIAVTLQRQTYLSSHTLAVQQIKLIKLQNFFLKKKTF